MPTPSPVCFSALNPLPSSFPARIFSVNDSLSIHGDGVVVKSPRIDIAGDLYFTTTWTARSRSRCRTAMAAACTGLSTPCLRLLTP